MFEVEKKFNLSPSDSERLLEGAEFISVKTFTDLYFDNGYLLTSQDIWLRLRGGKFELKIPLNEGVSANDRKMDLYDEVVEIDEIKKFLGIQGNLPLEDELEAAGFGVFCTITTTRKEYKLDNFTIVLDMTDFDYDIAEVEQVVEDRSQVDVALNQILDLLKDRNIATNPVNAKVAEYLFRNKREHYDHLVSIGVY